MDQIQPAGGSQATHADVDFAAKLLNDGMARQEIQSKLVERGLDQASAEGVVRDVMMQAIYATGAAILNTGVSPQQAEQQLIDKGLEPQFAKTVIDQLLAHAQSRPRQATGGAVVLQLLGGLVLIVGIGLLIGNITGVFRTFPFAGFIVMGVGGAILRAGQKGG